MAFGWLFYAWGLLQTGAIHSQLENPCILTPWWYFADCCLAQRQSSFSMDKLKVLFVLRSRTDFYVLSLQPSCYYALLLKFQFFVVLGPPLHLQLTRPFITFSSISFSPPQSQEIQETIHMPP